MGNESVEIADLKKENVRLQKKIVQWEVGLRCVKCAYTNVKEVGEENARLRDEKTLIGQTIIEYHGTEEWCKKNRSITDQKEGCRWCNLAKKALEESK